MAGHQASVTTQAIRRHHPGHQTDFGGEDASYLSKEDFEKLQSGEEETSLEVGLKSWCVVKLE